MCTQLFSSPASLHAVATVLCCQVSSSARRSRFCSSHCKHAAASTHQEQEGVAQRSRHAVRCILAVSGHPPACAINGSLPPCLRLRRRVAVRAAPRAGRVAAAAAGRPEPCLPPAPRGRDAHTHTPRRFARARRALPAGAPTRGHVALVTVSFSAPVAAN
jgi:hypothetical protein